RVEREHVRERQPLGADPSLQKASQVVAPVLELDFDSSLLPRDHPQWVKDAITVSTRARDVLTRLKPVFVTILTFWDHRIRSTLIGTSRVTIDPAGSYRLQ
ncbi:MAG TPA: hypothetical protein VFN49_03645, partial [Candidatus Aquilonibacter sp.]|nr:hypothetical protein [Candidatus Aquilonibacter sp.]